MAKIFISYTRRDRNTAKIYVEELRTVYEHTDVWYDASLHGGDEWWAHILRQIDACEVFIFLISNRSLQSYYCQQEIQYAVEQGKQILPVMIHPRVNLDNAPPPIQRVISRLQYIETYRLNQGRQVTQLIAAVLRLLGEGTGEFPADATGQQNYGVGGNVDAQYANFGGTINVNNPPSISDTGGGSRVLIAVAVIGALATLGAALIGILPALLTADTTPQPAAIVGTPFSASDTPDGENPVPTNTPTPTRTPSNTPSPTVIPTVGPNEIVVCFDSDLPNIQPYAVTFQNVSVDTSPLFGMIFPSSGMVTVSSQLDVRAAIYHTQSNHTTGSYELGDFTSFAFTSENVLPTTDNDPCRTELLSTTPLRVSPEHMIAVQQGASNNFVTPIIRGVFAFHFPEDDTLDFQLVQFNLDEDIEMRFPFLTAQTDNRYVVISNTYAELGQSVTVQSGPIVSTRPLLDRLSLEGELDLEGLDLYQIMESLGVQIYPYCGEINTYTPGSFVRLTALTAGRLPNRFSERSPVLSIRDSEFPFAVQSAPENEAGKISSANFLEFDDEGRMLVESPSGGNVYVLEQPWYMESGKYMGCVVSP